MKAITWLRDSHGLFDYEYKSSVNKDAFKLTAAAQVIRVANEVRIVQDNSLKPTDEDTRSLCSVRLTDSTSQSDVFSVAPAETESAEGKLDRSRYEKMYLVVKTLKTIGHIHGYQLCEGDVVRLGRAKFRVKELQGEVQTPSKSDPTSPPHPDPLLPSEDPVSDEEAQTATGSPCRVCLQEGSDAVNPLLAPCNCAGTMKLIHLDCLQHWLRSRLTTKASANVVSFAWKTLNCELCMKSFPSRIIIEGRVVDLLDIPKPESQYIILEGLCKDKNSPKSLHVVSMNGKTSIKIGRGHESELRVSDISVSRCHASIRLQGGKFYLEDENSKFGTLVQAKRPISLEMMEQLTIQTGRTLVTFELRKPWTLIPACFRPATTAFDFFHMAEQLVGDVLLPVGTGIPLTCSNSKELLSYASSPQRTRYHEHQNLMYNHNEIGVNSSCGEEAEADALEEMEVVLDQAS